MLEVSKLRFETIEGKILEKIYKKACVAKKECMTYTHSTFFSSCEIFDKFEDNCFVHHFSKAGCHSDAFRQTLVVCLCELCFCSPGHGNTKKYIPGKCKHYKADGGQNG